MNDNVPEKESFTVRRERLVKQLETFGYIKSRKVKEAMLKVPRHKFLPPSLENESYLDSPLSIGFGQTISAPHMVAMMLELLEVQKGHKILEIGTGSGYHAALLAELVGDNGTVITIERIQELAEFATDNLRKTGYIKNVVILHGDGSKGVPNYAPYDGILVTCGAPEVPEELKSQITNTGIIVIPIGAKYFQTLTILKKKNDKFETITEGECMFVPMVGDKGFTE